jgi:hypothetical protein
MLPEQVLLDPSLLQAAREFGWRLDAPFHMRVIVQPLVALLLGLRDGRLDAKAGTPPYLYDLIFAPAHRRPRLRRGLASLAKPLAVGVILDVIVQFTYLDSVSLPGALLVGGLLVGVPYMLARGASNRLVSRRHPWHSRAGPGVGADPRTSE